MTLLEYFKEEPIGAKKEMAEYLGITQAWMAMLINDRAKCSPALAKRIEDATQGLVTRKELRPDLFGD
jgi:DNA-binding transcriptional regulator YdaS (Cro superfamily)